MVEIEFDYKQIKTTIQANMQETFQEVINNYFQKAFINTEENNEINLENLCFSSNGNIINPEKNVESQMSHINKQDKKMKVLVTLINEANSTQVYSDSKEIICPKCFEPCLYKIENYVIKLYDCINNHITNNIKINDFPNTQKINMSNIICGICKEKNKANSFNNEFYLCLTCSNNLCPLCKINHDSNHNIIKYEQKNFICHKHNDFFVKYCKQCKLNLCIMCEEEHNEHNTIFFGKLIPNINKLKEQLSELKSAIDIFNCKVKFIIRKLNGLIKALDIYYKMQNDMINNYNLREKNYSTLQNLNEMNVKNEILEKVKNINEIQSLKNKIINMIDLSNKIDIDNVEISQEEKEKENQNKKDNEVKDLVLDKLILKNDSQLIDIQESKEEEKNDDKIVENKPIKNKLDKMTIIYDIEKIKKKIRIFGDNFVENNKK